MRLKHALRAIPEFDGLRGIAILAVMGFHLSGSSPEPFGSLSAVYWGFNYGWAGVDLFFVLSGFLITSILLNTKDSPDYFSSFYARRSLRIFPLYFAAVALFFYLELPLVESHYGVSSSVRNEQFWYWTYLSNWHNPLDRPIAALNHFWSLAIEEQFYAVWPLAIWLCTRKSRVRPVLWLCIGSIVVSSATRAAYELHGAYWEVIHRNTLTRFDALAMGGLVAVIVRDGAITGRMQKWIPYVSAGAILSFAFNEWFASRAALFYTVRYGMPPIAFACLLFYVFQRSGTDSLAARACRFPVLRSVGKYSYSMYVFHLVAVRYLMVPLVRWEMRVGLPLSAAVVAAMILSALAVYAFAVISWHGYEKHFLRLKSRFAYRTEPQVAVAAAASAAYSECG